MHPIIPKISWAKLNGFHPIFRKPVELRVNNNLLIVLGGNGLGKTTILQALIYGMAGAVTEDIEAKDKNKRWGREYFKDRLDNANEASVEVGFKFADDDIILKRNFRTDNIVEFTVNGSVITSDTKETNDFFEQYLQETAGYNNLNDFNYLIHKLCYLPESRDNIIWDIEAQTRVLMLVFSDDITELNFRKKRALLKELDSKSRHITVDINKIEGRIENSAKLEKKAGSKVAVSKNDDTDFISKQARLVEVGTILSSKLTEQRRLANIYNNLSIDVEELHEKLTGYEQAILNEHLSEFESNEVKLAIYKLLHNKLCPFCGNSSQSLYTQALEHIKNESCPLCGTENDFRDSKIAPGVEAEFSEKLEQRLQTEKELLALDKEIEVIREEYSELNSKINEVLITKPSSVIFIDKQGTPENDVKNITELSSALSKLKTEYNTLRIQFTKLQEELDKEYKEFSSQNALKIQQLSKLYTQYATDFLGINCELEPIEDLDKFLDLNLFVPKFYDKVRRSPQSCSEAQRFFLDIAFRMALINLSGELSGNKGTFVCETPENALDITYVNNVSDMFEAFTKIDKNTLIMTSNIQPGGVTESLMAKVKKKEHKREHILNMIEIGNLSEVQRNEVGMELLTNELNKLLN